MGVSGYINSSATMNQSQLLREAAASGISLEQAKTGLCSSIKHEMRSNGWEIKRRVGRMGVYEIRFNLILLSLKFLPSCVCSRRQWGSTQGPAPWVGMSSCVSQTASCTGF